MVSHGVLVRELVMALVLLVVLLVVILLPAPLELVPGLALVVQSVRSPTFIYLNKIIIYTTSLLIRQIANEMWSPFMSQSLP